MWDLHLSTRNWTRVPCIGRQIIGPSGKFHYCFKSPHLTSCFTNSISNSYNSLVVVCCSVPELCLTLWDPMDCSTPGFPVFYYLLEFSQTHVHWVSDAIQPSPHLSPPSHALNLFQHQGFFQWVDSSHQVAKVLELQLQHQSFQWIFRVDF